MKKALSAVLAAFVAVGAVTAVPCFAEEEKEEKSLISFKTEAALYAHAAHSEDNEAWTSWQCAHGEDVKDSQSDTLYFFLPSSVGENEVDICSTYDSSVTIAGKTIEPGKCETVPYEAGKEYTVDLGSKEVTVTFLKSSAEAAIFINNTDADGKGTELIEYLSSSKDNSAKATGAIVGSDGTIDNTPIKKIKGRGNTTWEKGKKPFNVTYNDKVSIAGMEKGKKYSLLANFQDDSLVRNRLLYDLSDAVGIPYASDSRFVDFYSNGYYCGSYQMTQKIEVGKSDVVNDIDETDYLNEDGTIKEDFAFLCEVDPNYDSEDYTVNCGGTNITIKSPELSSGDPGYDEVKAYVKEKYTAFAYACANPKSKDLSEFADIDSITKMYLINEFSKNWDSGVASTYFTYKKCEDGKYRFFGSPVWDYDNSLGNCVGVKNDLRSFGVSDYTKYTGWWCRFKGKKKNSSSTNNIMNNISMNDYVQKAAPAIWFEEFVPALDHFFGVKFSEETDKELLTSEKYFDILKGTAEMNYTSGWLLNTGDWISDHSKLNSASFNYETGEYSEVETRRLYPETFEGMYNYCVDWAKNRTAWLSSQMYKEYMESKGSGVAGDVNGDSVVDSADALSILRISLELEEAPAGAITDVNGDGVTDSADALEVLRIAVSA